MSTGINVTKPIKILDEGVLLTPDVSQINFTGGVTATTSGNNVTVNVPAAGITVGTTPSTGVDTRVFFQAGGVVQQDANFTFDNTLKRLTLKAVGTAATDIPFAVQNSAGTRNNLTVNGAGLTTSNVDATSSYVWTNHFQAVRFESGSPITNVNIKTNWPFVESFYIGRSTSTTNNDASTASGIVYSHQGEFTVRNTQTGGFYGITLNCEQNLEQRVGIDTGRTGFGLGWSLRNFTNSVDVINFATNSPRVGIGWNNKGAALGAILDVKAQGALSTDIAFRVRNSADTLDVLQVRGDTRIIQNINGNTATTYAGFNVAGENTDTYVNAVVSGNQPMSVGFRARSGNAGNSIQMFADNGNVSGVGSASTHIWHASTGYMYFGNMGGNALGFKFGTSNGSTLSNTSGMLGMLIKSNVSTNESIFSLGTYLGTTTSNPSSNYGGNTFFIANGTAPTATATDTFGMYSADITAGNAAPHFRTEAGNIIKLYQQSSAGIATVGDLVTVLQNLGLLS